MMENEEDYMKFDEYVWKNKISVREMARDIGIPYMTLLNAKNSDTVPKLHVAILIKAYTKGEVNFFDMIRKEHVQILDNFLEKKFLV